ncbi:MAG: hypothetical protein WC938_01060 [Candidatus Paceibacterota bacterium]|jgi:hypothetical protein
MKNVKTIIYFSLLGILFVSPAFAVMQYPEIGGININEDASAATYVVYFFNLAIAAGAFIAGAVLFAAGIDYVSARGEPAKLDSAKNKIKNAFLGLTILLAAFMILNIINPQLTSINISQLEKTPDKEIVIPEGSGIYLYDSVNYVSSEDKEPVRVTKTMGGFLESNFANKAESIKFNNPVKEFKFGAVLYASKEDSTEGSGSDLRGNCSYTLSDVPDLSVAVNDKENNPPVGKDNLASMLVFKTDGGSGSIKIYNTINCKDRTDEYGVTCKKKKYDDCEITGSSGFEDLKKACPDFKGDIMSIEAGDGLGILFKATGKNEAGRCQYIETNDTGCVNVVKYSYVYTINDKKYQSTFTPKSFVIFSLIK